MNSISQLMNGLEAYIIVGLSVIILIMLIMLISLARSISKLDTKYRKLTRGINNKNIEEIIVNYLDNIDEVKTIAHDVKNRQDNIEDKLKECFQKISILRYKAFDDVGSDLSFSIALLNENNDGVILTGIYGRHDSTVYAKPIDEGISRYDLSDEEEEVLQNACNKIFK
ncbi:hypothetical protein CLHOM_12940 [Clostridium homopropionicum DSM 5847]|uniref:DUF4446 domain-containing protein n=1 Tax=Clostridium homopropionicum DSM 5847 TaxID=1121318 RepID=A0A0L6ZBY6_9CLOT|nr:DUF4446 family protein [Clostridium homopropionicum]KOA20298.1 hypothetical protein CLHOM_12940 [Clostridium homopropionicum DSM 5847]SFG79493.1 Protein of unknown function [Clostridium homopropionicum]